MDESVSIIIPNYNGEILLKKCLDSLRLLRYRQIEIVVVDNNSTDNSVGYIKKNFPKVKVLKMKENIGYGRACNEGAKISNGNYLLFLNNDTKIQSNFLIFLLKAFANDKNLAIAQPKIYTGEGNKVESCGALLNLTGYFEHLNMQKIDKGQLSETEVFSVSGAALMVKRKIFERLKGFDESIFLYYEDADLCWRAKLLGYEVKFVPDAVIYHERGMTTEKNFTRETILYFSFKNRLYVLLKDMDIKYLVLVAPLNILLALIGALVLIFTGSLKRGLALLKGVIWNILNLKTTIDKRNKIVKSKNINMYGFKKTIPLSYLINQLSNYIN